MVHRQQKTKHFLSLLKNKEGEHMSQDFGFSVMSQ